MALDKANLLTVTGLASLGISTALFYKKSPETHNMYAYLKECNARKLDIALAVAKINFVPGLLWIFGAGCIIKSDQITTNKLVTTVAALETAKDINRTYREVAAKKLATVENGRQLLQELETEVTEKVEQRPKEQKRVPMLPSVIQTGAGDQLIVDRYTQVRFRGSIAAINDAMDRVKGYARSSYASYNDFYYEAQLPLSGPYELVGWNDRHPPEIAWTCYMDGYDMIAEFYFVRGCEPIENYKAP